MQHLTWMLWFITVVGAIAVFASLLSIWFGKKVGGANAEQQRVKILNHIEITQNSVLGLIFICAVILVAPAGMLFYAQVLTITTVPKKDVDVNYVRKSDVENDYIKRSEVGVNYTHNDVLKEQYQKLSERNLAIYGKVEYENGEPARRATVSVWGGDGKLIENGQDLTNDSGLYYILLKALDPLKPGDSLTLLASHSDREITKPDIKPDEIQLDFRLFQAGDR